MKKAASLLLASLFALSLFPAAPAFALTATGSVDVTVNLYPKCELTTTPVALSLNYVSFQTTASTNSQPFTMRCTSTLPFALSIAGAKGTSGTLSGLNYTLSTTDNSDVAAASGTGTGSSQTFKVKGTIAANQGGTCAQDNSGTAGTQSASVTGTTAGVGTACTGSSTAGDHTLTITY